MLSGSIYFLTAEDVCDVSVLISWLLLPHNTCKFKEGSGGVGRLLYSVKGASKRLFGTDIIAGPVGMIAEVQRKSSLALSLRKTADVLYSIKFNAAIQRPTIDIDLFQRKESSQREALQKHFRSILRKYSVLRTVKHCISNPRGKWWLPHILACHWSEVLGGRSQPKHGKVGVE